MDEHRVAETSNDALRAQPAGFLFIRIAPFATEQLLIVEGDTASADPILSIPDVDVIEIRQRLRSLTPST